MLRKYLLFGFLLLFFSFSLFAQVPVFKHFSVKDGLPSRETYFIFQDSKSYIWVCTDAGIAKYNGSAFKIFDSSVGLPDNTIFEVKEDKKGRIWFRSFSGYIGYIQNDSVTIIKAVPKIIKFQKEGIICSFSFNEKGDLFIGRQNTDTICFLKIKAPYGINDVEEIAKNRGSLFGIKIFFIDKQHYVFSESRPLLWDQKYNICIEDGSSVKINTDFPYKVVSPLSRVFSQGSNLYVSNGSHLYRFDQRTNVIDERTFDRQIVSVHEDGPDHLYVGFFDGLSLFPKQVTSKGQSYIKDIAISGIIRDQEGGLWFSSLNDGIFYAANNGLKKYVSSEEKEKVSAIFKERSYPVMFKYMVAFDKKLLGSNYKDLMVIDSSSGEVIDTIHFSDRVTSLAKGEGDQVWVGALHGLYKFYGQKKIRPGDRVLDCRVEDVNYFNGRLIVATKEKGVIIKYKDHQDTLNERSGLLSNISRNLYLHGQDIWVIGNVGICRISSVEQKYVVTGYPLSKFEGISSMEHVAVMDSNLFFSSGPDLYSYSLKTKIIKEQFYINRIFIKEKEVDVKNIADLSYDESSIRILFEALFYSNCGKIPYRYKLHAGDPFWNYTFENSINLNSLSPGDYEIIIQAKSSSDEWKSADEHVHFKIGKPFWLKWWFNVMVVIASVSAIILLFVLRNNRLVKREQAKNKLKARMADLEIRALKAQMNPHFIFNALNSVQQFVLAGKSEQAYDSISKFSKLIRKMLESNIKENIRLENEIDLLHKYIDVEALRFENAFNYDMISEGNLYARNVFIPHMLIQPFVENAIWHGLAHKKNHRKLSVRFKRLDEFRLICSVDDNGVGREFSKQRSLNKGKTRSLAIDFTKERLAILSDVHNLILGLEIIDKKNEAGESEGTLVEIIIPILKG